MSVYRFHRKMENLPEFPFAWRFQPMDDWSKMGTLLNTFCFLRSLWSPLGSWTKHWLVFDAQKAVLLVCVLRWWRIFFCFVLTFKKSKPLLATRHIKAGWLLADLLLKAIVLSSKTAIWSCIFANHCSYSRKIWPSFMKFLVKMAPELWYS